MRDRRDAPPALAGRPGGPPIRLLGGEGLCGRRESTRETTTFDVPDALCVLYADGEHVCDHFGLSDDDRSALVPARVAPPASDGELVVVGCDGGGDSLRCAERDRVTLPRALRSDVAWGSLRCVLLDDERLHCLAGDELSLASFATHLPPPVASGIVDVVPVGSRICIATRDERVLCLDATRFEAPGPTPELLVGLQFEPLALPW